MRLEGSVVVWRRWVGGRVAEARAWSWGWGRAAGMDVLVVWFVGCVEGWMKGKGRYVPGGGRLNRP